MGARKARGEMGLAAAVVVAGLLVAGCGESGSKLPAEVGAAEVENSQTIDPGKETLEKQPESAEPSLFSPVSEEHERKMAESGEDMEEIERRIEERARERDAAFAEEVAGRLQEMREHYRNLYREQIHSVFAGHEEELKRQYMAQLRESHEVATRGGRAVLAGELEAEAKRLKEGEAIPLPVPAASRANPGLELLQSLRSWYQEGWANLERSRIESEVNLTDAYRKRLDTLLEQVEPMSPELGAGKVRAERVELEGAWWEE